MHRTTLAWIVLVAASIAGFTACDARSRSPVGLEPSGQEPSIPIDSRRCSALATIDEHPACEIPVSPV